MYLIVKNVLILPPPSTAFNCKLHLKVNGFCLLMMTVLHKNRVCVARVAVVRMTSAVECKKVVGLDIHMSIFPCIGVSLVIKPCPVVLGSSIRPFGSIRIVEWHEVKGGRSQCGGINAEKSGQLRFIHLNLNILAVV